MMRLVFVQFRLIMRPAFRRYIKSAIAHLLALTEEGFRLFQESLMQRAIILSASFREFFQLPSLLRVQTGRHFNQNSYTQVPFGLAIDIDDSVAAKTKLGVALRSRRNLQGSLALQGRNSNLTAQGRGNKGERYFAIEVVFFAREYLMFPDMNHDVKISGRTAANPGLTVTGRTQTGSIVNAGRNLQFDPRTLLQTSIASTISAWTIDDLPGPATSRAGLRNLKEPSSSNHLSATLTGRAGHCLGAGFGATAMATPARIVLQKLNLFLGTKRCLLQSYL